MVDVEPRGIQVSHPVGCLCVGCRPVNSAAYQHRIETSRRPPLEIIETSQRPRKSSRVKTALVAGLLVSLPILLGLVLFYVMGASGG